MKNLDVSSWQAGPVFPSYHLDQNDDQEYQPDVYHLHFQPWVKTKGENEW